MFSHSQAPVEGPRLQGARRQGREIQIGFVLTGIIPEGSNYPNVHTFWCQSARVSWNIYCRNTTLWITQPLYQLPDFLKSCKNFKMSCLEFWTHSFIHSFHWRVQSAMIPCRSQELLPFLSVMYFFPAILLHQLFFHPLSRHLAVCFFDLPLNLAVPKFIYSTLLRILFPSILSTCPNHPNLFNLIVFIIVGF